MNSSSSVTTTGAAEGRSSPRRRERNAGASSTAEDKVRHRGNLVLPDSSLADAPPPIPAAQTAAILDGNLKDDKKANSRQKNQLVSPFVDDSGPPLPPGQLAASYEEMEKGNKQRNQHHLLEIIDDGGAPVPAGFHRAADDPGRKKAVLVNNDAVGNMNTSSPNSSVLAPDHNMPSTTRNEGNAPPQNSFEMGSSPDSQQSDNSHPPFYVVHATLVENITQNDIQYPEPSAPVISGVLVPDPDDNRSNKGSNSSSNDAVPDPVSIPPVSCWRRHQTSLLVAALVVIAALIGSIVSLMLTRDNNTNPSTPQVQNQPTDPTTNDTLDLTPSPDAGTETMKQLEPTPDPHSGPVETPTSRPITQTPASNEPTISSISDKSNPPTGDNFLGPLVQDPTTTKPSPSPASAESNTSSPTTYRPTIHPTTEVPTLRPITEQPETLKPTFSSTSSQSNTAKPTLRSVSPPDAIQVDSPSFTCSIDNDCLSNACGLESFNLDASLVCCSSHYGIYTSSSAGWPSSKTRYFCIDRPIGTECGVTDNLCKSEACVQGTCAESKTADFGECAIDNDCQSNSCGLDSFSLDASYVCCESGTFGVYTSSSAGWPSSKTRYFCIDRPIGTECGVTDNLCTSGACVQGTCAESKTADLGECAIDNDCQSNSCGLDSFSLDASYVCCESGTFGVYTSSSAGWPSSKTRYFCIDRPIGTECGVTDNLCASGACVQGTCAESKTADFGECAIDNDCQSNSCGLDSFSFGSSYVCCESGTFSVYTASSAGWPSSKTRYFCTDQPLGTSCGATDEICESDACVQGACASQKIGK